MLKPNDLLLIKERGSNVQAVEQQIKNYIHGFPYLKIIRAATRGNGLIVLREEEINEYTGIYNESISNGLKPLKFVPASGAASRMFKSLFSAKEDLSSGKSEEEILKSKDIRQFFSGIKKFAFCPEIEKISGKKAENLNLSEFLDMVLTPKGLNYGNIPKGLIRFHTYGKNARTPVEEHLVEGANYAHDKNRLVKIHFTVSPEYLNGFTGLINSVRAEYEQQYNVRYEISFSQQKRTTDTISVDLNNNPFREADGKLLFRPAGHGALLENLNELDADIVFIKNIDNVLQDRLKSDTFKYKKALAGLLIKLQKKIFYYQEKLDTFHYYALNSSFFDEAANFLENILNVKPPKNFYYSEKEELYHYLRTKYNRPIRVCGMVKNEGEPGGGPFFAINNDGSCSLQIAETSQIDPNDEEQQLIAGNATHFNPVDLICALKNYKGEKFDLTQFRDPETGFISVKSKDGKELKAQELPGLWNGSMADWNTFFVEVPVSTFTPVKTVNDLLRKEHQPD